MSLYWDPVTALPPEQRINFTGSWDDLLWLNVPGPFWTGETDTCWTGRLQAPHNVLYGGEYFTEFVFRQPRTPTEVSAVADAAWADPFGGYGCDGDDRWTPSAVRAWWRERHRIDHYIAELLPHWASSTDRYERDAAAGLRDFAAHVADPLGVQLRVYLFWLEERRSPTPTDTLPDL
ncbi:hypothetical protein [Dactylosporangium darangshiense]|uniref:Ferredoxin n=1 Tax=Dactylosporangium darangshiense TaxID=579108 RepID=A0ABP8DS90_9ACTN